jgi:hypothetical protein
MRYQWNALRADDAVRLHRNGGMLEPGTVAFVNVLRGSNGVGIRVVSDGRGAVIWPSRLAVHAAVGDTDDPGSPCLRCAALRQAPS